MEEKISVIVPVYNVEDFLPQCIESIINQTYRELEVILVDDGSPDNCPAICDNYASIDSRLKVVHKMNGGLSSARNAGLDVATGSFVSFIDSDDWLEPNMYEVLVNNMRQNDADVSVCQAWAHNDKTKEKIATNSDGESFLIEGYSNILGHLLYNTPEPVLRFEVWNKLFRRDVIGDIRFKVGQRYEDLYFERMVMKNVKSLFCQNIPLYNYRVAREGSTVSSFNSKRLSSLEELDGYINHLTNCEEKEIASRYILHAMDTILSFYYQAYSFKQLPEVKGTLINKYSDYYSKLKTISGGDFGMKFKLFRVSPSLFLFVLRAYRKVHKSNII